MKFNRLKNYRINLEAYSLKKSVRFMICLLSVAAFTSTITSLAYADESNSMSVETESVEPIGKVVGIKNFCVHVLELEKTMRLYREILGFKMVKSTVLTGKGVEGLLVMELHAGNAVVNLSLPSEQHKDTVKPIGNTNHNHVMLLVDDIVPICDKLKAEGYELENNDYVRSNWSFFTGPNGEIIGLTQYK